MIPPKGPINARIMLVGEAPGEQEVRQNEPFVGPSGLILNQMLAEAGITRSECFITNACQQRAPYSKISNWVAEKKKDRTPAHKFFRGIHCMQPVIDGVSELERQLQLVKPNVVVALGGHALWALTGETSITKWRGSEMAGLTGFKVVPTYHPQYIQHNFSSKWTSVLDLKRARRESADGAVFQPQWKFEVRPTYDQARMRLNWLIAQAEKALTTGTPLMLSVDIETRGHRHIACVGLAWSPLEAISIPLMCLERPEGYFDLEEELTLIRQLKILFPICRIVGQNFTYDQQYFCKEFGIEPRLYHDTLHSQHTLYPGTPKDLGYLSSIHCEHHFYWKDDGKDWDLETGEDQLWTYNCEDAARTYEIALSQQKALSVARLVDLNDWRCSRLAPAVLRMMNRGVRYDTASVPALITAIDKAIAHRQSRIDHMAGHPLNPGSSPQMQAFFYTDLNEPVIKHPKTKQPTLDDAALTLIGDRNPLLRPLVTTILDKRSLAVFRNNFLEAATSADGRMRTSFNISGPYTFRFSSSEDAFGAGMNLQNLPGEGTKSFNKALKRGSLDDYPDIKKLFLPDQGLVFWNLDLDRADLQVVVWEADDTELKQMLREGVDLHKENAKVLFGVASVADVTKGMREFAKSFTHGTNYGGSADTMARATGTTRHQAELAQRRWFSAHPGIAAWHERTLGQIQTRRMVENKFGFRCVFLDRPDNLLPEALAWIPQSTVACVINYALVRIHETIPHNQAEILLQVHDSIAGQCQPEFNLERLKEAARVTIPYDDPLIIPCSVKSSPRSWGHCE